MSHPRFHAPLTATLTAALLALSAGPVLAAPAHHSSPPASHGSPAVHASPGSRGGSPGFRGGSPGFSGGYRGGYSGGYRGGYSGGYRGGYSGGYRSGYYGGYRGGYAPGYFSGLYLGGYPGAGVGFYSSAYAYPSSAYLYGAPGAAGYYGPDQAAVPPTEQPQQQPTGDGTASVGVHVPPDADVWFDGSATQQKGEIREFATPALPAGHEFQYEVRARWMENGKPVDLTRTITVSANQRTEVDFLRPETLKPPKVAP